MSGKAIIPNYWDSAEVPGPWASEAACKGLGIHDATIHGETVEERGERYRAAGLVCQSCPVLAECNRYRLATPPRRRSGVLAGIVRIPGSRAEVDLLVPDPEEDT